MPSLSAPGLLFFKLPEESWPIGRRKKVITSVPGKHQHHPSFNCLTEVAQTLLYLSQTTRLVVPMLKVLKIHILSWIWVACVVLLKIDLQVLGVMWCFLIIIYAI